MIGMMMMNKVRVCKIKMYYFSSHETMFIHTLVKDLVCIFLPPRIRLDMRLSVLFLSLFLLARKIKSIVLVAMNDGDKKKILSIFMKSLTKQSQSLNHQSLIKKEREKEKQKRYCFCCWENESW